MKSKKKDNVLLSEEIINSDMSDVLIGAFNRYAKEVITDRAIPDARDGLKPVQRRILYDMFDQGYVNSKPTVKCATIVGHVMGHFHPHGDASIYDALVHLSQNWKMEAPLITFQGNNGSLDEDGAAASRYTEAKLSALSEYMCMDLDKETVRMVPTYDDKSLEPVVLPARFPNLLVNGTSGIAVGSVTYIPPHNLCEVIDAAIYRMTHKRSTLDDIINIIPGPDFPTGGIIDDKATLRTLYETGNANFQLYCKAEVDEAEHAIVIDEIPYGVVKKNFVRDLLARKDKDHLDNIEEILDESAKEYVKIVIKIKDSANPIDVLTYLQSKGALRATIACNFLAIDHGHPKRMSLIDLLDSFIHHQRNISTKAFEYDKRVKMARAEIVEGYIKVYSILQEVIAKIQKCDGKEGVKKMLMADYGFTQNQAEAIAMMPLYRLSHTDIVALNNELHQLKDIDIPHLNELLTNPDKLDQSIIEILKDIRKKNAIPRRTIILDDKQSFDAVDPTKLIAKEDVYVSITYDGYAKRTGMKSYQATLQALNKNKAEGQETDPLNLPKIKPGDHIVYNGLADTHQAFLLFTNLGNYAYIPVFMISDIKWKEEGKHLNNLVSLKADEKIVKVFLVDEFKEGLNVVILSKENKIKRTSLSEFAQSTLTKRPYKAVKLTGQDRVVDVCITSGNSDVIVCDGYGRSSRYNENEIPLVSTAAMGVKAMSTGVPESDMVSVVSINSKEAALLLLIGDERGARVFSTQSIEASARLGFKTFLIKLLKKNPWKIVKLAKIEKVRGQDNYASVTTLDKTVTIDLSGLKPIETNKEMRENLPNLGKSMVLGYNDFGQKIDKNTVVEQATVQKKEKVKASEENIDRQMTLFEMFEKNRNN